MNEYIVKFYKGRTVRELHISAHDEEQAVKLAEIQSKFCGFGTGKFELIHVRKEGEKDVDIESSKNLVFTVTLPKRQKP